MYIPSTNSWEDQDAIFSFMQRFSFATIINVDINGLACATHLPFVVERTAEGIRLRAHFAKANTQWQLLEKQQSLVIFSEPHAYVSPSHYNKRQNVPTWNYQAVHAYGQATILSDEAAARQTLEALILQSEASYLEQWQSLSEQYKAAMINGITAFEIRVSDLQAKSKLSQNKQIAEQERIANTYLKSPQSQEQYLGEAMLRNLQKGGE